MKTRSHLAFPRFKLIVSLGLGGCAACVSLLGLGRLALAKTVERENHVLQSRSGAPTASITRQPISGTFASVTAEGVTITQTSGYGCNFPPAQPTSERRPRWEPFGNTLWQVEDQSAIADGVAIDSNDFWGAWILQGARRGAYPTTGGGKPAFE